MKTMFFPKAWCATPRTLALAAFSLCILGMGPQKAVAQPAAPALESVTSTSSTSVTLTWTESDTNAGWYRVLYGTSSGNYTARADFGNVPNGTVTGLASGTTYYFAVLFYESGNSTPFGPSNELSAQVGGQPPSAGLLPPVLTSAASTSSTSVTLTWTESDPKAGWYRVLYGTSSGNYTARADFGRVLTGTVSGLTTGTKYFFAVLAFESGNPTPSAPSNELSAQVGAAATPTPAPTPKPTPTPTPAPTPAPGLTPPRQASAAGFNTLGFDEEFTGPLDIGFGTTGHKWNAGLWWEAVPPASAFQVNNHVLTITATATNGVNLCTQYHDASGGTSFQGGYFEARMLCTDWSAFWLFCWDRPFGNPVLPGNPLTWTNEIDIIETDPSTPSTAVTTLHRNTSSDGGVPDQQNANNENPMPSGQTVGQWHTYGVLWTQTAVTWYVDNVQVCTVAPYASTWQPTQLIFGAGPGGVNGGKSNVLPPITQVQWVHVWK